MLIRFIVENYRSFNEEAVFSMLPGQMKKHGSHVINGDGKKAIDVLKLGLIYGANASGKSNLVKAMSFARDFILDGVRPRKPISVEPFRLDEKRRSQPSRFEFEFIVNGQAYAYGFVIDRKQVHEEWLFEMTTKNDHKVFTRSTQKNDTDLVTSIQFGQAPLIQEENKQFLVYINSSTRYNELFLTKANDDAVQNLAPIIEWFESLTIMQPGTKDDGILALFKANGLFDKSLSNFMITLNTGISKVVFDEVKSNRISMTQKDLSEIVDELENNQVVLFKDRKNMRYIISKTQDGGEVIHSISTEHQASNEEGIKFDVNDESDGTIRLIDLFPIFYSEENRVFVVDELERSLHPNLVREILQGYIKDKPMNQLIVTTHESTLLDLDLLRRDEIWFVEKDQNGNSSVYSLEEFRPRADLDIRKGYLHGRYGAIPMLGHALNFSEA